MKPVVSFHQVSKQYRHTTALDNVSLDVPPGTVRSRIARGRAQLAELLDGNQTDPTQRRTPAP